LRALAVGGRWHSAVGGSASTCSFMPGRIGARPSPEHRAGGARRRSVSDQKRKLGCGRSLPATVALRRSPIRGSGLADIIATFCEPRDRPFDGTGKAAKQMNTICQQPAAQSPDPQHLNRNEVQLLSNRRSDLGGEKWGEPKVVCSGEGLLPTWYSCSRHRRGRFRAINCRDGI